MRKVGVIGVAMHPFGKFADKPLGDMCREVVEAAIADAGVQWQDVEAISAGSSHFSGGMGWGLAGNEVEASMGLTGIPVYNLSAACATGGSAFAVAHAMVAGGVHDVVLVVAGEKMPKGFISRTPGSAVDPSDLDYLRWACVGLTNPGYWALECTRWMAETGATERDLAAVSVKARAHGAHNVNARYRTPVTIEEVLASPMVSEPFRLFEVCAVSDGAAAAVICSEDVARRLGRAPVWIAAAATATASFGDTQIRIPEISTPAVETAPHVSEVTNAVRRAFQHAAIDPKDVDVIELQDNTVWQELAYPELWGLCRPGESAWLAAHGETGATGKMPINPSGGFLSFGEATTAMGVFQVCELVWQLRGAAGPRQVPDAKVALGQTRGLGGNGAAVILTT